MKLNATPAIANSDTYAQKLQEANTQVELLNELGKYMNEPGKDISLSHQTRSD